MTEIDRVQKLLRAFGAKLKYQKYRGDDFPKLETVDYHQLQQEQDTDEEEFIAKLYLEIKDNLALAFVKAADSKFFPWFGRRFQHGFACLRMERRWNLLCGNLSS